MTAIAIKIVNIILEIIYIPLKMFPSRKKITFISRQTDEESFDIMMLRKRIRKKIPDCEVVVLMKTIQPGIRHKIMYGFHMLKQMYHIATSRIVVLDTYCIVISLLHHKKRLIVIQMWHALGLMKKAGYSILDKPEGRSRALAMAMKLHKNYHVIFASSEHCRTAMGEVFGYPAKNVYSFPLPRVDLLRNPEVIGETKRKLEKKYPQLQDKETILYAPTFRKDETMMNEQVEKLISIFPYDEYNVIFKFHPLSKLRITDDRIIMDKFFSTMELLTVADYVISDYSSIIFEAAIMGKPLLFFDFDLNNYQTDREFFIDYRNEMPGPICSNAEELLLAITNYQYNKKEIISFAGKYVELSIDDCTDEITEFLKELLGKD